MKANPSKSKTYKRTKILNTKSIKNLSFIQTILLATNLIFIVLFVINLLVTHFIDWTDREFRIFSLIIILNLLNLIPIILYFIAICGSVLNHSLITVYLILNSSWTLLTILLTSLTYAFPNMTRSESKNFKLELKLIFTFTQNHSKGLHKEVSVRIVVALVFEYIYIGINFIACLLINMHSKRIKASAKLYEESIKKSQIIFKHTISKSEQINPNQMVDENSPQFEEIFKQIDKIKNQINSYDS